MAPGRHGRRWRFGRFPSLQIDKSAKPTWRGGGRGALRSIGAVMAAPPQWLPPFEILKRPRVTSIAGGHVDLVVPVLWAGREWRQTAAQKGPTHAWEVGAWGGNRRCVRWPPFENRGVTIVKSKPRVCAPRAVFLAIVWVFGQVMVVWMARAADPGTLADGVRGLATRAPAGIKIDGDLAEFQGSFCTPVCYHETNLDADLYNRGAQFFYMWDDEAFYAGLRTLTNGRPTIPPTTGSGKETVWSGTSTRGAGLRSAAVTGVLVRCTCTGPPTREPNSLRAGVYGQTCYRLSWATALPLLRAVRSTGQK